MKKILAMVDDIYEDLELWYPKLRLEEEGWQVAIAGPETNRMYKGKHGYPCQATLDIADVESEDYDALLVPGGFAPDKLRRDANVLRLVREFDAQRKPIAFICHAGWILISAGILKGRKATSTVGIKDDMTNAGAIWVNEALVVDGHLISSRTPVDLPVFGKAIVDALKARG
ncbi:MAG TPA: type 1 glutamine amidotransferase domain-containing protein [Kiritimatiellia bacterium]|nr:type 1 glutamine amidotransferase domain-containing protein [Kiritimatiellia bacterium]HMO99863.1 type 1 glutamine amidotransferase domain-containing protein [Kiritimatiellia bacterium]HMP96375.1 type 1 glutamine amidotransferase domain-containing protein [Kiritimatiellia bacterium]